jgi:selenocysteine lyase/cysteine desulfurase
MSVGDKVQPSIPFGSFREKDSILPVLPASIASLRSADIDWKQFSLQKDVSHLNHGAFGAVPCDFQALEAALRQLADSNPSYFYDKLCIPLLRESVQEASAFFNGTVILQPNCTVAMRSVLGMLCKDQIHHNTVIAVLEPIYGATRKLLSTLGLAQEPVTISPGFFNEDASSIVADLEAAYANKPFHILVADRVASQSGRLLPLRPVVEWCSRNGVTSVVDGTQDFTFQNEIWPDYFVMSTHKWLCNVKTCAIIRMGAGAQNPEPVGVSFGYPDPVDRHLWVGMLDYIPSIMLAKALRVYRVHGTRMVEYSSNLLRKGLQILATNSSSGRSVPPPLPDSITGGDSPAPCRVMSMVETFSMSENLQDELESYGLFVSVKQLGGKRYLRVSVWTYNTDADFILLRDFMQYRLRLNYGDELGSTLSMQERTNRKRSQLLQQFNNSLDLEERLYNHIQVAGFFQRAESLRHPLIFYYGHVAVFYINKLILGGFLSYEDRIDPELESLCAVGVDEMVSWALEYVVV